MRIYFHEINSFTGKEKGYKGIAKRKQNSQDTQGGQKTSHKNNQGQKIVHCLIFLTIFLSKFLHKLNTFDLVQVYFSVRAKIDSKVQVTKIGFYEMHWQLGIQYGNA